MPIIRFHAIKKQDIITLGIDFQKILADKFQTGVDNITIEIIESTFLCNAQEEETPYPMVEILSFKREKSIEKSIAQEICKQLRRVNYPNCDVFYIHLSKELYYVDGEEI